MSAIPKAPSAPRLRATRKAWLGRAIERLEADPAVSIDGLPLHADWYVYPHSQAAWVADARVIFDEQGLRRLDDTFREHLDKREVQPAMLAPVSRYLDLVQAALGQLRQCR